jgi:hypothetical protein
VTSDAVNSDATRQLAAQLLREMADMTGDPALLEQLMKGRPGGVAAESAAAGIATDQQPVATPAEPAPRVAESPRENLGSLRRRALPNAQQMRIEVVEEPADQWPETSQAAAATGQAMIQAMQQVTRQGVGRLGGLGGEGRANGGSPALANLLVEQVQNSMADSQLNEALGPLESMVSTDSVPVFDLRGNRPLADSQIREPHRRVEAPTTALASGSSPAEEVRDWRVDVSQAIANIEMAAAGATEPQERENLEVYLRLLRLIASDREAAVRSIESLPAERQEYWREQIYALSQILQDPAEGPAASFVNHSRQATKALTHLQKAMRSLQAEATLQLRQVQFCQEIRSFGDYDRARSTIVGPGDPMLIYAEVVNYLAQRVTSSAGESFQTSLIPSYSIFNDRQQVVSQKEFAVVRDHCRSLRQDFFLVLQVEVPNLPDGKYHIQVSVEDLEAGKSCVSAPLSFQIRADR